MVEDLNIEVPPQALITILQKGMLYMQLEKAINMGAKNEQTPEQIINSLVESVHQQEPVQHHKPAPKVKPVYHPPAHPPQPPPPPPPIQPTVQAPPQPEKVEVTQLRCDQAILYRKHIKEVFCGAWTSDGKAFASGSNDATAIIWECHDQQFDHPILLDHALQQGRKEKGVLALAWNSTATLLATGCNDGTVRLWTNKGALKFVLGFHKSSIFAIQFSPDDNYLLTCSYDTRVVVWDVARGQQRQIFQYHKKSALDVDWYDNQTFASCSGDQTIIICKVGQSRPLVTLTGHEKEVNKIAWDDSKKYLASGSDDGTVRVWKPFENGFQPIVFRGHEKEVYTIKWVPQTDKLASGAFDHKVRVWDVSTRSCAAVIDWKQDVFSISFSPKGRFFVIGGKDSKLGIFRSEDIVQIGEYETAEENTMIPGGVFEAMWSPAGDTISLCEINSVVALVPTKLFPLYNE